MPGCSQAAQLVYVLSEENDLYSFDPPNKAFKKIGALGCQTTMTPNSMAVARDATAWVNYTQTDGRAGNVTGGAIYKVSTADASCQATNITLPSTWWHLGMGYSTNSASSTDETLFISADGNGGGLATLDTTSGTVTPVAKFPSAMDGQDAELTGTGNGRLFGFFVPDPSSNPLGGLGGSVTLTVAQIDKASAATSSPVTVNDDSQPDAWAFSSTGATSISTCTASSTRTRRSCT